MADEQNIADALTLSKAEGSFIIHSSVYASKLQEVSRAIHPHRTEYWRTRQCLLMRAAAHIERISKEKTIADNYAMGLRRERDEARVGIVKPDWWNDACDGEHSYSDPDEAFTDRYPDSSAVEIVELVGSAEIDRIWGFVLPPAPGDADGDDRKMWFPSLAEAERVLAATLAEDANAQAKLDEALKCVGCGTVDSEPAKPA